MPNSTPSDLHPTESAVLACWEAGTRNSKDIARKVGKSRRRVQDALKALDRVGYIDKTGDRVTVRIEHIQPGKPKTDDAIIPQDLSGGGRGLRRRRPEQ